MPQKTKKQKIKSKERHKALQEGRAEKKLSQQSTTSFVFSEKSPTSTSVDKSVLIPSKKSLAQATEDKENRTYFIQDFKKSSLVIAVVTIVEIALFIALQAGLFSSFLPK
jgi:hypothetical protein